MMLSDGYAVLRVHWWNLVLLAGAMAAVAAPVTPVKSDNFVERVAVVTHFGYANTPYATHYDSVKTLLGRLGVRYVRDGAPAPANAWTRRTDLYTDLGIRYLMVTGSWGSKIYENGYVDSALARIKQFPAASIAAIEGVNEYDNSKRSDWVQELRNYTRDLYTAVKSDAVLKNIPVVGPTLAKGLYGQVGDLSAWVDIGALHWYSGGKEVTHSGFDYFTWHRNNAQNNMYPGKKLWLTETGYNNAMNTAGHGPLSEYSEAKYLPRALIWFLYDRNIDKVFSYEFVDERPEAALVNAEMHFGMVRYDLTPKPVYFALKNMISLFRDTDTSFFPRPLDYSLSGDTAYVRQALFQKSSGEYLLALWKDVRSFNVATRQDSMVPPALVTIRTAALFDTVKVLYPCDPDSLSLAPRATFAKTSEVTIAVPDHVTVVVLKQKKSGTSILKHGRGIAATHASYGELYDVRGRVFNATRLRCVVAVCKGTPHAAKVLVLRGQGKSNVGIITAW